MKKAVLVAGLAVIVGIVFFRTTTQKPMDSTPIPSATPSATPNPKKYGSLPALSIDTQKVYHATITTNKGTMKLTLFAKDTPVTVNNFVCLARDGFSNDTVFHRIIKGFMIQGGDPEGTGAGGPGYRFNDEPVTRDYTRGTIAMANAGANTNGSQFFIMHQDYALQKNYVIFGGIDPGDSTSSATLDAIAQTPVTMSASGEQSVPTEKIVVQSVIIEEL